MCDKTLDLWTCHHDEIITFSSDSSIQLFFFLKKKCIDKHMSQIPQNRRNSSLHLNPPVNQHLVSGLYSLFKRGGTFKWAIVLRILLIHRNVFGFS